MNDTAKPETPREVKRVNILDQLKKLDEQRAKLIEDAKAEALAKANAAVEELNALGFSYRLSEGSTTERKTAKQTRQRDPNKPCAICGFLTSPPHDARQKAHRDQGDTKKPLTAAQLKEAGLTKVA